MDCIYTSASSKIVDCSESILGIYPDIVVSYLHGEDCIVAVKVS